MFSAGVRRIYFSVHAYFIIFRIAASGPLGFYSCRHPETQRKGTVIIMPQVLFYLGIALMGTATVGAVAGAVILSVSGKRLKAQLEKEFGKKRN